MNSVDILFVLLVTICVIAIIIILCKKSKKSRNEVVGDAVIEITEKFNSNNLGDAIDNVIQSAFHEVNDINDKENDKENDDNIVINYKSNVYYGNDIDGYSGDGQYHDADPANNNSSVSDHNNINHNHNYIPDKDHHHIHNSIKHHTRNIYEEDSGNNLGVKQTHFSPKKHSKKSKKSKNLSHSGNCTMGGKKLPSEYSRNGCNLYKNYKDCLSCAEEGYCGVIDTNGNVYCETKETIKSKKKTQCSIDPKTNPIMNCLHSPDDDPNPGFGCPGKNFTSENIPPINPNKNNNNVCKYHPK